ncbi:capsule polysaccharide export inner-membrane protein KpsE [Marinobacterium nitratireducens]|uniref:Capsule polysaccharide export inner-membrane protein KpsE n=1 Tax=Marinobacterium nitratireducens TaxID=518897 RepID=A0A917ZBB1_9GAMM|nr:chain-length determining protein [Marinobacterium nitratireducens]GGO79573.1 capsule polysaccharide export inner-membrane protein KpsE [Marinobacterium nitratireducens]
MYPFIKRYPYWFVCLLAIVIVGFYQLIWASDRYVSEANVVLESPQLSAPTLNFQSLLSGGGNNSDMLLLRDYLLSVDMLKYIDAQLGFRKHYSEAGIDFFSALSDKDVPTEELHQYYLKHVEVELDDYAGVLRIRVSAFTPDMAHAIVSLMLEEGEQHMNQMGQRLAEEQVRFLETQVDQLAIKFDQSRKALIEYQNENGLTSPTGAVESINAVVASLEAQLANLRAKRTALRSYQSSRSADIRRVEAEIDALIKQISQERARTAQQAGGALNVLSSEYQTLELSAQFAQQSYSGALVALENTRIEAARKLKQLSVLQNPTLPEYPLEPQRLYNLVVFTIIALFLGLIVQMLVLIVRDHRD